MKWLLKARRIGASGLLCALVVGGCGGGGSDAPPVGSLSGTITVADRTISDSDVNSPSGPHVANDSLDSAQAIPAPATVGGYVNIAGAGPDGSSKQAGDAKDVFLADLRAGMQITLHIAGDGSTDDLDLYLIAADDTAADLNGSVGTAPLEVVDVVRDGHYYVLVQAAAGAANYILSIGVGRAATTSGATAMRLSDDFVPGEAIVAFRAPGDAGGAARSAGEQAAALGLRLKAGGAGQPLLLDVEPAATAHPRERRLPPAGIAVGRRMQDKLDTLLAIKALRRQRDVAYAEPNYVRRPLAVPNDPLYPRQWHYALIHLPAAWDLRNNNDATAEPVVAVIDTGVLAGHPDLQDVLSDDGYDFIRDPAIALDGDGIDPDPHDPGDQADGGSTFHGSHVAGTIAARSDNGIGVAGISWGARIMPLRVLGKGGGTSYDVQQAMRYAAGLPNSSGRTPRRKADIINLSLGGTGWSRAEQDLVQQVRAQGLLVVAAAGNHGADAPFYPAAYHGAVAVSAVDRYGDRAPYSNYGSYIDVAAPGGDLAVDLDGDGYRDGVLSPAGRERNGKILASYRSFHGTSMAAPHVAGVAALMKALAPAMTPADFDALLASGDITGDAGLAGRDDVYGNGLIDAYKAVLAAYALAGGAAPIADAAFLSVRPAALALDSHTSAAVIAVEGFNGARVASAMADASAAWLGLAATAVDGAGLGYYTVAVDRAGLAPGSHTASVAITASTGSVRVPVTIEVAEQGPGGDAGLHYVLLLDAATHAVVAQRMSAATEGRYRFAFADVPHGSYYVVAGADTDNNGHICGPGEACAAYASVQTASTLSAEHRSAAVELRTRFDQTLPLPYPPRGFRRLR